MVDRRHSPAARGMADIGGVTRIAVGRAGLEDISRAAQAFG